MTVCRSRSLFAKLATLANGIGGTTAAVVIMPLPQHHSQRIRARGQVAQLVERSPEKAGVGGSTPSLATIISKHLPRNSRFAPAHNMPTKRRHQLDNEVRCWIFLGP